MAFRHVRRRPLQSLLTILGVTVGVAVLIIALALTNGFIDELIESTLQATPHVTLQAYDARPFEPAGGLRERIDEHPHVVAAAPDLSGQALIARRANTSLGISGRSGFTQLLGIDVELEQRVLSLPALRQVEFAQEEQAGIILGESLAIRQLGVYPGDEVFVRDIDGRSASFTVLDTFFVGNELIDSVTAYLPLESLQGFLRAPDQISGFHVRVEEPQEAARVGLELAAEFGLLSTSWEQLFSSLLEQLQLQKAVISVVVFLIVIVAAMGIANILVLTVAEKTEEIAILRALGASRNQILAIFTTEGVLLGGTGTLLGAGLGLLVSLYFRYQPYPLPGDLYFITQLPVQVQPFDVLWVCGVSLLTSVVAGLLPARRAASLQPADILR